MRQIALLVIAPVAAAISVGMSAVYSSPQELWASVQPLNGDVRVVNAGAGHEEDVVRNIALKFPAGVGSVPAANRDCFQDLAQADAVKLDRCAGVVYQALIEVERQARKPVVSTALATADKARVVEQLKFAAAEVCRSTWSNTKQKRLMQSPACEVAEIRVALDGP